MTRRDNLEVYIGACILGGVILVAAMILAWGSGGGIFGNTYKVIVDIQHVGDLRVGAPIKLGGYPVGRVVDIRMAKNNKSLEIECDIDQTRILPKGSTAHIATAGLVGDAFLEIKLGTSGENIANEANVANADHMGGFGPIDYNELLGQIKVIGVQVTSIVSNLNDIVADPNVKKNIKESVANINATSLEANRLLKSFRRSSDNIEIASANVLKLSEQIKQTAQTVDTAITGTIGDKRNIDAINATIAHVRTVSKSIAAKSAQIEATIDNIKEVSDKAREVVGKVEAEKVKLAIDTLTGTINDASKLIGTIRREIAIALVINKGADRIIDAKFKEMMRDREIGRDPDKLLDEFNRWVKEHIKKGAFVDPKYEDQTDRPYDNVGKTEKKHW